MVWERDYPKVFFTYLYTGKSRDWSICVCKDGEEVVTPIHTIWSQHIAVTKVTTCGCSKIACDCMATQLTCKPKLSVTLWPWQQIHCGCKPFFVVCRISLCCALWTVHTSCRLRSYSTTVSHTHATPTSAIYGIVTPVVAVSMMLIGVITCTPWWTTHSSNVVDDVTWSLKVSWHMTALCWTILLQPCVV